MDKTIDVYHRAQKLHRLVVENLFRLRETINEMTVEEMVDVALGLRETARLLNDGRKECDDCLKTFEQAVCLLWVHKSLTNNSEDPVRGEYAIGTPRVKLMMHMPKRDTEEYSTLLASMGVPESDLVRPHWPSMVDHVSTLLSEGKQPPPGMSGETYDLYTVTLRKRKDFPNG